jgi:hypothetical protein
VKTFNFHFENHAKNLKGSHKKKVKTTQHWFTHVELTCNICLCWGLYFVAMAHNSLKKFLIIILLWKFTHVELRGNICLLWLCDIFGLQRCLSFLVFMTWFLPTLLGFLRVCSLVLGSFLLGCPPLATLPHPFVVVLYWFA